MRSTSGRFLSFDHITFWVGNAKQAAAYYCIHLGFKPLAYKGLETNSRQVAIHVVHQNEIIFVFASPLRPGNDEMGHHLTTHGDGVKDIAFEVQDLDSIVERARDRGGHVVRDIWEESDSWGSVRFATVKTFGDITHTFVERGNYGGIFLPGFSETTEKTSFLSSLPQANLTFIDHCVGNQLDDQVDSVTKWYEDNLAFKRFWTVDYKETNTQYSGLRSIIITNTEGNIKFPMTESAPGIRKSQVQEFNEYNGGPGIQHIGLHTDNILQTIKNLKERGTEFLYTPDTYYVQLKERLKMSKVKITEDFEELRRLKILVDYDDNGYLLQVFAKPLQDRPTFFVEIIQRHNHNGFGAGNFKALFEAIEIEQQKRGNL